MRYNRSKHVFSDIGGCTAMTLLDMSDNQIEDLAPEIGLMIDLQELRLNYNALRTLPPELGSCTKLQTLELTHNAIEGALPGKGGAAWFAQVTSCRNHWTHGNIACLGFQFQLCE